MIPVRLALRNFMCYRDNVPPLDFTGIRLTCLWGDNGNGKSALIDAMTWALWGRSRTKSDDDLIYASQHEMEVQFDFAIGGQTYRIIRKRARPKHTRGAGQSSLNLFYAASDGFKLASGDSIARTQDKITDLLHMNYETFINSAYLRQGNADEFTKKRPAERKEVLADILGLSFYDGLEADARSLAREQDTQKVLLENAIREMETELANQPVHESELAQVQQELSSIENTLADQEKQLEELRRQKETMLLKKSQMDELEIRLENTRKDLTSWQEQYRQHESRIKQYEELTGQRAIVEAGFQKLTEARKLAEELDRKARQAINLERRKMQLESKIQQAVTAINTEHAMTQRKIQELEAKTSRLPDLKSQRQQINERLRGLTGQEEMLKTKKQSLQELQEQIIRLESANVRLEQETNEIDNKLGMLVNQTAAKCPLCGSELGDEGMRHIESEFTAEKQRKNDAIATNKAALAQQKSSHQALQQEIRQLEVSLEQGKIAAQSKASVLESQIAEAETAGKEHAEQQQSLSEIEQRLVGREFAAAEDRLLREVDAELAQLAYDPRLHESARQSVAELNQYESSQRKLEEADRLLPQEKEYALRAETAAGKARQSMEADEQKRQTLSNELAALPALLGNLSQAEIENQHLTAQRNQMQEKAWGIKAKLQHCTELSIKKKEKEAFITGAAREESIYKELAEAFGKSGVPALLIEIALPEIEIEANRLLGRMTDNRMHLKFETQRPTKTSSGIIETLDIKIADELGTRNYEMFSGGEAFRINFAVRIALSRLLAKRAGAPLRTLIIDEGFGTQDATGIEKLKEAIISIQDDFDKIIVITHIEELRDAFPNRIDVTRTAEGSMIAVS
ncbi:MAG: SMC family ATPase [Dehalococcoidales bacterium]|nr:SMC family ATPase [Dehalococcoidales bacterium]